MPTRIAIDIDSTLHHYWDQIEAIAQREYGVALPYADQREWGITTIPHDQLHACVKLTHSEEYILAAEPYPDAVETVTKWHEDGHWIHITSHRDPGATAATARWLDQIGLPYDDLRCDYNKVARCVELGIDILIDDSPWNMKAARDEGILPVTLLHPWNEELAAEDGMIGVRDWRELREALAPRLEQ
jgi:uncharacterized HAD superfamily protein